MTTLLRVIPTLRETDPDILSISPKMAENRDDFPDPTWPTIATREFFRTWRLMFLKVDCRVFSSSFFLSSSALYSASLFLLFLSLPFFLFVLSLFLSLSSFLSLLAFSGRSQVNSPFLTDTANT